jgi:hypothetical protein
LTRWLSLLLVGTVVADFEAEVVVLAVVLVVVVDAVVLAPEVVVLIEVELAALEEAVVEAEVELAGVLVEPLALAEPWKVNCKLKLGSPVLSVILKA